MSIKISIVYFDQDLIELKVEADNGRFKGQIKLYASHDSLTNFAETIESFPSSSQDTRRFSLGNFDSNCGGGGAKFNFMFYQRTGHAIVEVKLRTDEDASQFEVSETAHFVIPIEAAAVDKFVKQMISLKVEVGAFAVLEMAT